MSRVKEIIIKIIPKKIADNFVKKHHYSGKVVNNSNLHFGLFLDDRLHGVLQYGPSLDKSKLINLVKGTQWDEFIELNRMALDDFLPRNSESYCIAKTLKMIKKNAPHIKWVVSFADGVSCGDGTIYRASNFILTQIKKNTTITIDENNNKVADLTLYHQGLKTKSDKEKAGFKIANGYMFRYLYLFNKKDIKNLNCEIIPFSKIKELGASMYKGVKNA